MQHAGEERNIHECRTTPRSGAGGMMDPKLWKLRRDEGWKKTWSQSRAETAQWVFSGDLIPIAWRKTNSVATGHEAASFTSPFPPRCFGERVV